MCVVHPPKSALLSANKAFLNLDKICTSWKNSSLVTVVWLKTLTATASPSLGRLALWMPFDGEDDEGGDADFGFGESKLFAWGRTVAWITWLVKNDNVHKCISHRDNKNKVVEAILVVVVVTNAPTYSIKCSTEYSIPWGTIHTSQKPPWPSIWLFLEEEGNWKRLVKSCQFPTCAAALVLSLRDGERCPWCRRGSASVEVDEQHPIC